MIVSTSRHDYEDARAAAAMWREVRREDTAEVTVVEAAAATASRYTVVCTWIGMDSLPTIGGHTLVVALGPYAQATAHPFSGIADVRYVLDHLVPADKRERVHWGDLVALTLTVRAATGTLRDSTAADVLRDLGVPTLVPSG